PQPLLAESRTAQGWPQGSLPGTPFPEGLVDAPLSGPRPEVSTPEHPASRPPTGRGRLRPPPPGEVRRPTKRASGSGRLPSNEQDGKGFGQWARGSREPGVVQGDGGELPARGPGGAHPCAGRVTKI